MTDFPQLKMKALVNFPAQANGGVAITITQAAGIYTVNLDYTKLSVGVIDLANSYIALYNILTKTYQVSVITGLPFAPLNNPVFTGDPQAPTAAPGDNDQSIATTAFVTAAINANNGIYRVVTAAGAVTIATNDRAVAINKTVGAATAISLPAAATKNGPVTISDIKRDAGTNNITITPNGAETIQGLPSLTIAANGAGVQLFPLPGVGGSL
jgi:hypothetical protein